jgi:hypothetical protein
MQHERLEYQWGSTPYRPEWVTDLFTTFFAWHTVGPKSLMGEIGMRTKKGVEFAMPGDWIIANIDGTYSVETDEQHAR